MKIFAFQIFLSLLLAGMYLYQQEYMHHTLNTLEYAIGTGTIVLLFISLPAARRDLRMRRAVARYEDRQR
jgi:hypothetical protein